MHRPSGSETAPTQVVGAVEPFDAFYLREFPRIVAVVLALTGRRWAAEELAQEAFIRAYRRWATVATYDKPGAWVRRVAINLATSHLRRRIVEARAVALLATRQRTSLGPHPADDAAVWDEVRSLPRRQRQAFVLHYVDDLPLGEIAAILDIAETTVKTHLQRAREAVRAAIEIEGTP